MKFKIIEILCVLTFIFPTVLSSCNPSQNNDTPQRSSQQTNDPNNNEGDDIITTLGKFISCTKVTPVSAAKTINNNGMSGLNSSVHLHSTDKNDAFISDTAPVLVYDFEKIERLGYMYIWNLNAEGLLDCGLKDVKIEYSVDGEKYYSLSDKNFTLARALEEENIKYAGNAANNQNDGERTPIDFGGVSARYVKITALSNYSGSRYGLSEIRFFNYKTRPTKGSEIYAFSSAPLAFNSAENVSNGVNLRQDTVSSDKSTAWSTPIGKDIKENFILINLDGQYPVDKITIYNYNVNGEYDRGIESFKIEYCTDTPYVLENDKIDYTKGDWISLGNVKKMPASTSEGCASIDIDFNGKSAQYIKITPHSNFGAENVGIAAVKVFADKGIATVPEYEWTGLLSNEGSFPYQKSAESGTDGLGWLFADGIFSTCIGGSNATGTSDENTKTMFIFSDTFYGNFKNYFPATNRDSYGLGMNLAGGVNHSMAYLVGNRPDPRNITFWYRNGSGNGNIIPERDWLTGLVSIGKYAYTFGMRFNSIWMPDLIDFAKIKLDDSGKPNLSKAPEYRSNATVMYEADGYTYLFGTAILNNTVGSAATPNPDGYIYIYGYRSSSGSKKPIVARSTEANFENEKLWEFYDGSNWVNGIENTAVIGNVEVSSEYSVHYAKSGKYQGKLILCYTEYCESGDIRISTSDSFEGRFDTSKLIYHCNERQDIFKLTNDNDVYAYNAKCHPHLSKDGELLISYNVNSHNFDKTKAAMEYLFPHFVVMYEIKDSSK